MVVALKRGDDSAYQHIMPSWLFPDSAQYANQLSAFFLWGDFDESAGLSMVEGLGNISQCLQNLMSSFHKKNQCHYSN